MIIRVLICLMFLWTSSIAQTLPGQYPHTSQRILTIVDIDTASEATLRIMRNEIFARYGYIFKSPDLTSHFSKTPWYKATAADVTAKLTEIEKSNIDFLRNQETRIKTTSDFESFFDLFRNAIMKDDLEKAVRLSHLDRMGGDAGARKALRMYWNALKKALENNGNLTEMENQATLTYDTRNDGTTQDFIVFEKIGPCWYIVGFDGIG